MNVLGFWFSGVFAFSVFVGFDMKYVPQSQLDSTRLDTAAVLLIIDIFHSIRYDMRLSLANANEGSQLSRVQNQMIYGGQ